MGQEEHKLSTVAETNATLGSPQTETVDPGTPKVKKPRKLKPLVIVGSSEEATPGQTHVQETTIKLGGTSGGTRGGTVGSTSITGRKFRHRNLGAGVTSSGRLIRRHN